MNQNNPKELDLKELATATSPKASTANGTIEKQVSEARIITSDRRQTEASAADGSGDLPKNANDDSFQSVGWQCFRHLPYLTEEAKTNVR